MRIFLGLCSLSMLLSGQALAETTKEVLLRCNEAIESGDMKSFESIAVEIQGWTNVFSTELMRTSETCLSAGYGKPWSYSFELRKFIPDVVRYSNSVTNLINEVENKDKSSKELVTLVTSAEFAVDSNTLLVPQLESLILDYVKPLPASNIEANINGYRALLKLRPGNAVYTEKLASYKLKLEEKKQTVLKKLKSRTDDFDGTVWYSHEASPKYNDIRPYVTFYISELKNHRSLILYLNYTARSWLFVDHASVSIDGEIIQIPNGTWFRDNDTEIWEWMSVGESPTVLDIGARISQSEKSVIRFYGQQFYDDYVVTKSDKSALADMLLAWETMSKE